jgi:glycosyltransferase involved in cell wall biosynthesis
MRTQRTVVSLLSVMPIRIGGLELYARELSRQLGESGWKSVLCFESRPEGRVREYLELPNTELEVLPHGQAADWAGTKELIGVLRKYRPRIVHFHFTPFLSSYTWTASVNSAERVFFTDHGSRPEGHRIELMPWWKIAAARVINFPLTQAISPSDYVRRCLVGSGYASPGRVHRIYNATEIAAGRHQESGENFRARHGIPFDRTLVVQASWIIPEKGIGDLLEAARRAIATDPNIHLALVGEGNYRPQFMQLAAGLNIGSHVTWTGLVDDPIGDGVFAAADIVCQMSRWEEAFGYVIAEAMAHGKPLIATKVGAIPELVTEGETGYLVDRGDTAAMADRILRLAGDPGLRLALGEAGRRRAAAEFDIQKNVSLLLDLYGIDRPRAVLPGPGSSSV